MSMPSIKICGITTPYDAQSAIQAGADWIGLIFTPASPRCLSLETALQIRKVIADDVAVVGVFQDQPLELMQRYQERLQLEAIQLHGQESIALCQALAMPVIKTMILGDALSSEAILGYASLPNLMAFLFDLPKESTAGLTTVHAQAIHQTMQNTDLPFWIAGKLDAHTVQDVIHRFQPDGVDVASGVESDVGVKDAEKMQAFCAAVRQSGRMTGGQA